MALAVATGRSLTRLQKPARCRVRQVRQATEVPVATGVPEVSALGTAPVALVAVAVMVGQVREGLTEPGLVTRCCRRTAQAVAMVVMAALVVMAAMLGRVVAVMVRRVTVVTAVLVGPAGLDLKAEIATSTLRLMIPVPMHISVVLVASGVLVVPAETAAITV